MNDRDDVRLTILFAGVFLLLVVVPVALVLLGP
jgi:hypothetical protein